MRAQSINLSVICSIPPPPPASPQDEFNRREGKSARQSITHKNKTPLVRGLAVQRAGRRGIGGIGADPCAPSDC